MSPDDKTGILAELRRAVRDFGFPAVVAGWLLYDGHTTKRDDAQERREVLVQLTAAVTDLRDAAKEQTRTLAALARETRDTADVVRATWPEVRVSRARARRPTLDEGTP